MKARSFFALNWFSYPIISAPLLFLTGSAVLGFIPWWFALSYYGILASSTAYLHFIRLPHLKRVAICLSYFGTVRCSHGKYLCDEICEPCADAFIAKQEQAYLSAISQVANVSGPKETVH